MEENKEEKKKTKKKKKKKEKRRKREKKREKNSVCFWISMPLINGIVRGSPQGEEENRQQRKHKQQPPQRQQPRRRLTSIIDAVDVDAERGLAQHGVAGREVVLPDVVQEDQLVREANPRLPLLLLRLDTQPPGHAASAHRCPTSSRLSDAPCPTGRVSADR